VPKTSWPEFGNYEISACGNNPPTGATVLAAGSDAVYYRRTVVARYESHDECGISPDAAREHFITAMLSAKPDAPPIPSQVTHTIGWSGEEAYQRELAAFTASQQQRFADVATKLVAAHWLADEEAATRPKLDVQVVDLRSGK
jgi:hypothetical protein